MTAEISQPDAQAVDGQPGDTADEQAEAAPSAIRSVIKSAGVRVLILPISAGLGIVNTRLIIEHFGTAVYAQYGLLVAIGALLPFADLGMSAAIMNAVGASEDPARDDHVVQTLVTSIRILICSAAVLFLIDVLITVTGVWPSILGDGLLPDSGPQAAALCLGFIALALPVGFGQRVLTGIGKNHLSVAVFGLTTPVVLVILLIIINFDIGRGSYLPVIPYVVVLFLSLGATVIAAKLITPSIGKAVRKVPRLRTFRGAKVFDVAWPMLIVFIAVPMAMQTDRIVLSHVSNITNMAEYNLASQMYLPVWQVVSAAGVALWPLFARSRAAGNRRENSPVPIAAGFGAAGAGVCVLISIASPWLARFASGGEVTIGWPLILAFSVLMTCQAAKYPFGVFLTDASGLRFQAFMIVLMMIANLGLSIVLAEHLCAVGPVIASAISVIIFELIANYLYVRSILRRIDKTEALTEMSTS
ncbi:oligosaccharide flippase family protein [soil metagenome]